jgi:hypothetical protein
MCACAQDSGQSQRESLRLTMPAQMDQSRQRLWALEVSKPLVEKPAQYGNNDRSQEENDNGTDRIHSVDVVLVEPLDDLSHADLGLHADNQSLTHHQMRAALCVRAKLTTHVCFGS